ncbi:hypothetical protein V5O48_019040 [Marasmius crinis-equi]|uniref:Protein kinase domain-containing protein n=1 Tax=Marasmius crinis-equi TaxID=585013 RepID=A0ABR3EJH3_9AGAR
MDVSASSNGVMTVDHLRTLLSQQEGVQTLLDSVECSQAQYVVDLLQDVITYPSIIDVAKLMLMAEQEIQNNASRITADPGAYRKRCKKSLQALVDKHDVLPSSLFIKDIVQETDRPLYGGGFSDVYRGVWGRQKVCLKVLRVHLEGEKLARERVRREFHKEALLWTRLSHPNLLPCLGVNATLFPEQFCMVSPWMPEGDVITFLKSHPQTDRLLVILEIAAGISYLHSLEPEIVHGDIKGANVLVDGHGRCYLADFGLSIAVGTTLINKTITGKMQGSVRWMAPELFDYSDTTSSLSPEETKGFRLARDIYAYACTVYEV